MLECKVERKKSNKQSSTHQLIVNSFNGDVLEQLVLKFNCCQFAVSPLSPCPAQCVECYFFQEQTSFIGQTISADFRRRNSYLTKQDER